MHQNEASEESTTRTEDGQPKPMRSTGVGAHWLLLAGAAVGLTLATIGLLEERSQLEPLSPGTAAIVGQKTIRRLDYERVLAGVEGDLRNPIDDAMRRRILDRMIEEELLVQRALDLGLASIDRRVRGELTSGLIDSIVSDADGEEPSARDVAEHYEANIDFFTRPGRLRAETLYFSKRKGDAIERAHSARTRLSQGESPKLVEQELGDRQISPPPNTLLPPSKVRDYVGPTILEALMNTETGLWSEPIESGGGVYLARTAEREAPIIPSLDEIQDLVRNDLKRRRGDAALRAYLDELRKQTPVDVNESIFEVAQ